MLEQFIIPKACAKRFAAGLSCCRLPSLASENALYGFLIALLCTLAHANAEILPSPDITETVFFSPPQGWLQAKNDTLPPHVKVMVVGKGKKEFPPSINLSTEEFEGTLKDYLKIVREINHSQGSEWRDLGTIRTNAGEASLSQADVVTQWGSVRMMHVILPRNGMIYILTAASLKEEFPMYYKTFFDSLRSLNVKKEATEFSFQRAA